MNTRNTIVALILVSMALASCSLLQNAGVKVITPSDVIISEVRDVNGFNAIEFSTFGKINIIQGDVESLNISGPDNLVAEMETSVRNQTLIIKSKENISVTNLNSGNMLTFTIVVKNLTSVSTSGLGDMQVDMLSTPSLAVTMSGAGYLHLNQINADQLNITISGLGGMEITGQSRQATIELSGAGGVTASELQVQNANVTLSGLGGATLWVTDQLTGTISGAGSVSYYGNPQTSLETNSLGKFEALGNK
jgi:hypothetical protein